jgi:hypothetical protein
MTRRAPEFRPPRSRQAQSGRRRMLVRYGLLTGAAALIIALGAVLIVRLVDDDDGGADAAPAATSTAVAESTGGSADSREPTIDAPSVQFALQLEDAPPGYEVFDTETYGISLEGFASSEYFATYAAGELAAGEWAFVEGFKTEIQPPGRSADVARGEHYLRSEIYRFETLIGAREAYAYLERHHAQFQGSQSVETLPLGNESTAVAMTTGTVSGTELPGSYQRFIARRGNLVYIVQVYGALQYTTMAQARDLAVIIDEKIIGDRPAPLPTPTPVNSGAGAAPTIETTPEP